MVGDPCAGNCVIVTSKERDVLHVDVVHAGPAWSDDEIVCIYRTRYEVEVVEVEPASIAAPSLLPHDDQTLERHNGEAPCV